MFLKHEITEKVLNILKNDATPKDIKIAKNIWWVSKRTKEKGGLRLTEEGFEAFVKAEIKCHKIKIEKSFTPNNKLVIYMDNYLDCPFFLTKKEIYVFGDKLAVQLVLFSGNIPKFVHAKAGQTNLS